MPRTKQTSRINKRKADSDSDSEEKKVQKIQLSGIQQKLAELVMNNPGVELIFHACTSDDVKTFLQVIAETSDPFTADGLTDLAAHKSIKYYSMVDESIDICDNGINFDSGAFVKTDARHAGLHIELEESHECVLLVIEGRKEDLQSADDWQFVYEQEDKEPSSIEITNKW